MLTEALAKEFFNKVSEDHTMTSWHPFAIDSNYIWAIVYGWVDSADGVGVKVAYCPRKSLMNEYDMDWIMPYDAETGDVDDTETILYTEEDSVNAVAHLNRTAQRFMDTYVDKYIEGKL